MKIFLSRQVVVDVASIIFGAMLAGCGGGGGATSAPAVAPSSATYALGGNISGLGQGATLLLSNGAETINVNANGAFHFATKLGAGQAYAATLVTDAPGEQCSIGNASGSVGSADVTTITVTCQPHLLAGLLSTFQTIAGLAVDAAGNYYVADLDAAVIYKVTPAGVITIYAGVKGQKGNNDGPAVSAKFAFGSNNGMLFDAAGNLYVAASCNQAIRKITPAGVVSTLAGLSGTSGCNEFGAFVDHGIALQDGSGSAAVFARPEGMIFDRNGDLLVTDRPYHVIRRVTMAGVVSTVSWGFDPADPVASNLTAPYNLAMDAAGSIYVTGLAVNYVWKISGGVAHLLAGNTNSLGVSGDGQGAAATFTYTDGIAIDPSGKLWVTDGTRLRTISATGLVTTVAGSDIAGKTDGSGAAAGFDTLTQLVAKADGTLLVADYGNRNLREISPAGVVTTVAATPGSRGYVDGAGAQARLDLNAGRTPAADAAGNLYMAEFNQDVIRKISPQGVVSLFAGQPGVIGTQYNQDGSLADARLKNPEGVASDGAGNLYVVQRRESSTVTNSLWQVSKISPTGTVSLVSYLPNISDYSTYGIAADSAGNLVVSDVENVRLYRVGSAGVTQLADYLSFGHASAPNVAEIGGMAFSKSGDLFVTDLSNLVVYKIDTAGAVSILAGGPGYSGNADGFGQAARFSYFDLLCITLDPAGNVYTSGLGGQVRKITPAGVVTTFTPAWGMQPLLGLQYANGILYGVARDAILQMPLP